jgi:glutamyl-tRNA reductase
MAESRASDPAARLLIAGLSHRSAPAHARERLFVEDVDRPRLLADLRAAGFGQAVAIATCERVEVATLSEEPARDELAIGALLAGWADMDRDAANQALSIHRGHAALRHLFAVAASLESVVVGEPQVLGQLKDSHRAAADAGVVGPELEQMLQAAYTVAKRVRSETALTQQPVSIAAAAIKVARQIHGDLRRTNALLLGLGEMSDLMAAQLNESGVARMVLAHPTRRRADAGARRLGCHARDWDEIDAALTEADVVVAALGEGRYILDAARMRRALKARRQRPMFVMDAAVPADVEPAVDQLDSAFVYDLNDLEQVAQEGRAKREAAALAAWRVVDEELDAYARREVGREAVPAVTALRRHAEGLRAEVLASGKLDASAATRLLINRLLHAPTQVLREAAQDPAERAALERSLERLFGIARNGAEHGGDRGAGRDDEER